MSSPLVFIRLKAGSNVTQLSTFPVGPRSDHLASSDGEGSLKAERPEGVAEEEEAAGAWRECPGRAVPPFHEAHTEEFPG